jgi:hypothetical protein
MRKILSMLLATVCLACGLVSSGSSNPAHFQAATLGEQPAHSYLGFDRNVYPGDAALGLLRQTFSFSGYWLNLPPGETVNTWQGRRDALNANGFGFLVLFNGRLDRELRSRPDPKMLGARDATIAVDAAKKEGFPAGTIIFLDQEEGGRMLPEQSAYVYAWVDAVNAAGYRAGIYCSGIPAKEGGGTTVITANDLRENSGGRKIVFFVYNDACLPSMGCGFPKEPPSPRQSGVPFAAIWQFAQSPCRRELTAKCAFRYNADGNCYAPLFQKGDRIDIDVESADSPDPSAGRR